MSGYDYRAFLESVRRVRRTAPTGCFYCDVVLPETCGPAATRTGQRLCEERSAFVVDAHHVIPKQLLKRELNYDGVRHQAAREIDAVLMDPRNGVLLRRYCHDLIEARTRSIPLLYVPESVIDFANELGLGWYLDKMDDRRTG